MLTLITPQNYCHYQDDLNAVYNLRYKRTQENTVDDLIMPDGIEKDDHDEKDAYYLLYKDNHGNITGCLRFTEL